MHLNKLLDIATFSPNSIQSPNAWVGHMPFAAWVIQEISPTIFVELGTHSGNSYFSFCQAVAEAGLSTKCYAVDTWQGDEHAGQYDERVFAKVSAWNQEHYAGFSRLLRMTFADALAHFADESIELLHIDGLHTYEAVRHDFDSWFPKLAPGAVVMFHDTNVFERNFGVWKLWQELQAIYPNNLEFMHSHGLGVLQLNNASDNKKVEWLQPNFSEKQKLISYFASLGLRQLDRFELSDLRQRASDLNQAVAERDGQIASLSQAVTERDGKIASLNQAVAERNGQIASLSQAVTERDLTLHTLINSKSWMITKPVRWLGRLLRGEFSLAMAPFKRTTLPLTLQLAVSRWKRLVVKQRELVLKDVPSVPIAPTHPVAVILPIYRDVEMSRRCILAAMPGVLGVPGAKLLAINDASPDHGMQGMLEDMTKSWPANFFVLQNETNQGFVRTVNRGIEYFSDHDVVLLNSDVVVPRDWLRRLRDEAYSRAGVCTVTPFSNNATICSFPEFLQENPQPFGLATDDVDAVFRHFLLPCIETPTGVGFCMYVRRACLDQTGPLDAERFGRGYGEENDLCQRALKKGWRNLITPNIYVFHEGGVSFSSDKNTLVERALHVLDELHPNYHVDVHSFIKNDPVKQARVTRYIQLLSTLAVPKVLHISHNLGGGVRQHVDELAEYLGQRVVCLLLTPADNGKAFRVRLGLGVHADELLFRHEDYWAMLALLRGAGVTAVHFHHTLGLPSLAHRLPVDLGVKHVMTVHDYYWLSANPTLTDASGSFSKSVDNPNNSLYPLPAGYTLRTWRDSLRPLIEGAECVIFPSRAAKDLFDGYYRIGKVIVAPHVEARRNINAPVQALQKKKRYVIGILGAISREKGADYLEEIALLTKRTDKPYDFKLIGYAYKQLQAVDSTGPYQAQELPALIRQQQCDLIFFPVLCPETYSYTLSYALESGLPIVAPSIGAFPERLSGRSNTLLYRPNMPVREFLEELGGFITALEARQHVSAPIWQGENPQHDLYARAYIDMMTADVRVMNPADARPIPVQEYCLNVSVKPAWRTWREILLHLLWKSYMHSSFLHWLGNLLPYGVRRSTKRLLSSRPIHDVVRGR